jgi:hypothetical protein
MPQLRLQVPAEWIEEKFVRETGFDAKKLLDHLVEAVCGLQMEKADSPEREMVPLINRKNLKHALMPVYHSGVAGDRSKGFLHLTFAAGNDNPGRTAEARRNAAEVLGDKIDDFVGDLPGLGSVTVHVQDIDRDRGYTTTASRKKRRAAERDS